MSRWPDHLDSRHVPRRGAERAVARDHGGIERLGEGHVHRVVHCKVLAQFPRASREVEMAVPNNAEQSEVLDRFLCTLRRYLTRMDESSQRAEDLHVEKMRRVEIVVFPIETLLDPGPERRLEQELGDCGSCVIVGAVALGDRATGVRERPLCSPRRAANPASIRPIVLARGVRDVLRSVRLPAAASLRRGSPERSARGGSRTYRALFGRARGLGTPAAAGSGVKSSPGLMKRSRSKWYCLS